MLTDVECSNDCIDYTGSTYNCETALVTINSVVKRCDMFSGLKIAVLSPYKAQALLHWALHASAINRARLQYQRLTPSWAERMSL
jgi:hypothetical protein